MAQLNVAGLCKTFSDGSQTVEVLNDVNLQLNSGDNLSIVGPSGCGKSTLLYILGTLDQPTTGTVQLGETSPFDLNAGELAKFRNESVGFVFQDHHLLPQLTVLENVTLPAVAQGKVDKQLVERAEQLIDTVGLADRVSHVPAQLSGGERQRVAVARALLNRPKLLLADEPTGNLDQENTEKIAELLFDLPSREKAMLVVVTHSQWLADQASKRMILSEKKLNPVQ